jgi:hypothetical protein
MGGHPLLLSSGLAGVWARYKELRAKDPPARSILGYGDEQFVFSSVPQPISDNLWFSPGAVFVM